MNRLIYHGQNISSTKQNSAPIQIRHAVTPNCSSPGFFIKAYVNMRILLGHDGVLIKHFFQCTNQWNRVEYPHSNSVLLSLRNSRKIELDHLNKFCLNCKATCESKHLKDPTRDVMILVSRVRLQCWLSSLPTTCHVLHQKQKLVTEPSYEIFNKYTVSGCHLSISSLNS